MFRGLLRQVGNRQNSKSEIMSFRVDQSEISNGTNAGITEGGSLAVIEKISTGTYELTLNDKPNKAIQVVGAISYNNNYVRAVNTADNDKVRIACLNSSGAAVDDDFSLTILAFYAD